MADLDEAAETVPPLLYYPMVLRTRSAASILEMAGYSHSNAHTRYMSGRVVARLSRTGEAEMERNETAESLYGRQIITLYADTLALVDRLELLTFQWDEETVTARVATSMFRAIVGQIDSFVQARVEMLLLEAMRAQADASREYLL